MPVEYHAPAVPSSHGRPVNHHLNPLYWVEHLDCWAMALVKFTHSGSPDLKPSPYVTLLDTEDLPKLAGKVWYYAKGYAMGVDRHNFSGCIRGDGIYGTTQTMLRGSARLHRLVLGLERGDRTTGDHIDGLTADNRRKSLRTATYQQNAGNINTGMRHIDLIYLDGHLDFAFEPEAPERVREEMKRLTKRGGVPREEITSTAAAPKPPSGGKGGGPHKLPKCVYLDPAHGYYAERRNNGHTVRGPYRDTPEAARLDVQKASADLRAIIAARSAKAKSRHVHRTADRLPLPPVLGAVLPLIATDLDPIRAYLDSGDAWDTWDGRSASEAWGDAVLAGRMTPDRWARQPAGRIHSEGPMLQAIPQELRHLFSAPAGYTLVDIDWRNAHATIASAQHGDGVGMRRLYRARAKVAKSLDIDPDTAKRAMIAWLNGGKVGRLGEIMARHCPRYAAYRTSTMLRTDLGGRVPLCPWEPSVTLSTREDLEGDRTGRAVLALRLQAAEARAMDDVLLALPEIEGVRLITTMYDGLLVALPCTPDEVRGHPALRAVVRAMRRASRERWGIAGGVKVRWGETWAMGSGEVVVPGDP